MRHDITPAMLRVLRNLHRGMPACSHCKTRSDYGGLTKTMRSLREKGMIDREERLTAHGLSFCNGVWGENAVERS